MCLVCFEFGLRFRYVGMMVEAVGIHHPGQAKVRGMGFIIRSLVPSML